ncbi:MAG: hypothetical protein MJ119_06960 [Lachnospiraceae bacterium]|nr:hypothetical protein [Lachnospiraceae bacterium]
MFTKIKGNPLLIMLCIGIGMFVLLLVAGFASEIATDGALFSGVIFSLIYAGMALPVFLFAEELVMMICALNGKSFNLWGAYAFDALTFVSGIFYEGAFLGIIRNVVYEDWNVQLINTEMHSPLNTEMLPTFMVLLIVSILGYTVWTFLPLAKTPPLISVLCIGAIYMGMILEILFGVQCFIEIEDFPMAILPVCMIMMGIRTVTVKVKEWDGYGLSTVKVSENPFLSFCNRLLNNSKNWPLIGFFAMIPLLGIIIGILVLFGQAPDAAIKAFTETADWRLSAKEAPQNLIEDEHYLCTVAAGGHRKVVKPQRYGVRHGHRVIVNRQLCVANAFEQILEEKTPKFHKFVRHVYDTYGFPVAKMIKTKTAADIVYFIMKPLEWVFLIVLYLTDVKPENRITVQYMGKIRE